MINIDGLHGFNASLNQFASLFDQGLMTIINRVGYPNASRSHFKSMDFWQGGGDYSSGWLGRYLDSLPHPIDSLKAVEISDVLSPVLRGESNKGVAFDDMKDLYHDISNPLVNAAISLGQNNVIANNENLKFIYDVIIDGKQAIEPAYKKYSQLTALTNFPDSRLGHHLKSVAEMIISELETEIFYVSHGTFDTHVKQSKNHNALLSSLSTSVSALVQSLRTHDKFKDVCILIFSEFGRRVKENASLGTDHGAGNSMYVISQHLQTPGFYNAYDTLSHLPNGDLSFEIDFRQIYASLLEDWLQADSKMILRDQFNKLNLFSERMTA